MNRKPKVPENISAEWRSFGLPRDVSVAFWNYVHADMVQNYATLRMNRDHDDRGFRHRKVIKDSLGKPYLFVLFVDDTTSAEHLILTELRCIRKQQ